MPRVKSLSEKAAGKLISAIQKDWHEEQETGDPISNLSEDIMVLAHRLLQARTAKQMRIILDGRTVAEYLGLNWVNNHPNITVALDSLAAAIENESK